MRDRIGEIGCFLGLVTCTCGKISMDVKLLMQTEVAEVYEPFHEGRGSSSTMPQKRNPIASLYIHANAAVVRQNVASLLEAAVADHERSTGPWEIEWIVLPEIFLLAAGCLRQTRDMLTGLEVDAKRMRANLDITHGTIVSEAVMMGLGPHLGRQRAHDLVYDICRVSAVEGQAAGRPAGAGQGNLQARLACRAGENVRPRKLSRARRRDGGSRTQGGSGGEARVDGSLLLVMPALVAGIHVLLESSGSKTWMAGTSPAMTSRMTATATPPCAACPAGLAAGFLTSLVFLPSIGSSISR